MHNHWTLVVAVFLLLGLASSTALADRGIGLRWSIALPGLSARTGARAPGLHVVAPSVAADRVYVPAYSLLPLPGDDLTPPIRPYDVPPGLSFYYMLSQSDDAGRDPSLFQLTSPPGLGLRTMGLTVKYPF